MATTITAPSQSTAPRWLFAAFAALAAVALVVALSVSLDSESNSPATGVTPSAAQVVGSADSLDHASSSARVASAGSADSIDHAASSERLTPAEARRNAANERSAESGQSRVPSRAF